VGRDAAARLLSISRIAGRKEVFHRKINEIVPNELPVCQSWPFDLTG
jgi:hypothetical protein